MPSFSNEIGSEPYLRLVARLLASSWVNEPLIWASPLIRLLAVAAEMTGVEDDREELVGAGDGAGGVGEGLAAGGVEAQADDIVDAALRDAGAGVAELGASMIAGESRYFTPEASQVMSGWLGSSVTVGALPSVGQV